MINLTGNFLCAPFATSVDDRGPPNQVRSMRQECDEYKTRCLQYFGTNVPEDHIPAIKTQFNIEEQHVQYRYKTFDGYFPITQWILRQKADQNNLTEDDVYVLFCCSENCHAPRDMIAVELKAWKEAIDDANQVFSNTLPAIVNNLKPII